MKKVKNKRLTALILLCLLFFPSCQEAEKTAEMVLKTPAGLSENTLMAADAADIRKAKEDAAAVSENRAEETPKEEPLVKVRGIYVTGPIAGHERMEQLIDLVGRTELNAMVIDIKNDLGEVTYQMASPMVQEVGSGTSYVRDMKALVARLKEQDIYLIARIVAFKDPKLAAARPDLSLKRGDGSVFKDKKGLSWISPYQREVWEYLMEIAKEAAAIGFDEIQFDYIRFSTDQGMGEVVFSEAESLISKTDIITEFSEYAWQTLKPFGVSISADVYGTIIHNEEDSGIVGQDYKRMAGYLDYICPMTYPSHYAPGAFGIANPDASPYEVVLKELEHSKEVLSGIPEGEKKAGVRVWIQDFTASWLRGYTSYGAAEVREQIRAVYDAGYEEWILWNARMNYTEEALEPAAAEAAEPAGEGG